MPPPLEMVALDASTTASGATIYSLETEQTAQPRFAFTARAWTVLHGLVERLIADRCAMRAQLQVANGGAATPDPICRGVR